MSSHYLLFLHLKAKMNEFLKRHTLRLQWIFMAFAFGYLHQYDEKRTDLRALEELKKNIFTKESEVEQADKLLKKRYKERISSIIFLKAAFPVILILADFAVMHVTKLFY